MKVRVGINPRPFPFPGLNRVENNFFWLLTRHFSGLLVGRGKKGKFRGIFRDKFAEKNSRFRGNF